MSEKPRITPLVKKFVLDVQMRWMIRKDMAEVLLIEQASFASHWEESDFLCCLRRRNSIGFVAEWKNRVVGFMIYELHRPRLDLLTFAVDPLFRRQRVGSQMIQKLKNKLAQQRRDEIRLLIRETNLTGQLFFRNQGFIACRVARNVYENTDEAGYEMRFLNDPKSKAPFLYTNNRITKYYRKYEDT